MTYLITAFTKAEHENLTKVKKLVKSLKDEAAANRGYRK